MQQPSDDEEKYVRAYFASEAPDLSIEFVQKVYEEHVLNHRHDVWDVHTDKDRWWVITNPANLYSQQQFPNMDLALTFHVGLCLRIPRSERARLSDMSVEPFGATFRGLMEASEALRNASEVQDYQTIGVRCREALLAMSGAAQLILPWSGPAEAKPKQADFKAWIDHFCSVILSGAAHENRRALFKGLLDGTWRFANWLTHAKASYWHDAEAAVSAVELAVSLTTSTMIRHFRGVPNVCPACGSHRLSPERGHRRDDPTIEIERPTCDTCGWTGEPVLINAVPEPPDDADCGPPEGDCIIPTVPLRRIVKPGETGD